MSSVSPLQSAQCSCRVASDRRTILLMVVAFFASTCRVACLILNSICVCVCVVAFESVREVKTVWHKTNSAPVYSFSSFQSTQNKKPSRRDLSERAADGGRELKPRMVH